ncbi:carbohydrate-binding domain-containing protein [Roseomonas gilardii]|uniref:carbohydrate-binding domain-containing protein n=1 Tax=Roseomonas gilardii TaxID=257708 RepID=UPI0004832640|nr:carbohydrate-binding domain-containing protein [Roseomonas gilardii]SUE42681.1 Uncharacterised protein [Roseomonas gilardii subsp. rosea]
MAHLDGKPPGEAQAVTVSFLNDACCGTPGTDRNLYVESIGFDGAAQEFHQAMMTAGCMDFQIG